MGATIAKPAGPAHKAGGMRQLPLNTQPRFSKWDADPFRRCWEGIGHRGRFRGPLFEKPPHVRTRASISPHPPPPPRSQLPASFQTNCQATVSESQKATTTGQRRATNIGAELLGMSLPSPSRRSSPSPLQSTSDTVAPLKPMVRSF